MRMTWRKVRKMDKDIDSKRPFGHAKRDAVMHQQLRKECKKRKTTRT